MAEALGGLPPIKMHCSNLAADGLVKAIEDYQKKSQGLKEKVDIRKWYKKDREG